MYILEGNIGSGKTTFLTMLQQHAPEIAVSLEPLTNWQKESYGQSLLGSFYQDPCRWAYSMETFAMQNRVLQHLHDQQQKEPLIVERSIYSGHYCFATNGYAQGFLSQLEWTVYSAMFKLLVPGHCYPPRGFIYLRVNPHISFDRIKKRSRSEESAIPFDYIQSIHAMHEQFLIKKTHISNELLNVPVLILDCNEDFESDPSVMAKHLRKLYAFIEYTKQ
ncbi:MAG: hypothetical protein UU47_C0009G0005 [candidate division TM6 bacterium GW2011_GWE2_41_16]|nr:MAG: hypothetical protein UU47_C0009G0005 [candidate division TM6 bacterium GW2011_GWE2_41_16]